MIERSGGAGIRAAARCVDGVIVLIIISIVFFVAPVQGHGDGDAQGGGWLLAIWVGLYVYFVAFDALWGTTPAKRLLGLRVTGLSGSTPTWRQAAVRNAFLLLPIVFGAGGLVVVLHTALLALLLLLVVGTVLAVTIRRDPDGRGWHDRLAGTRVLSASTPPAAGFSKVWLVVFFVFQAVALTWLIQSTSSISDDLWVGLDVIFTLIVWIVVDLVWVIVWTAQSRKQSSR